MAAAAEQWVLVEMVQALYEVSLAARAAHDHTQPRRRGAALADSRSATHAGLAGSRPDPRLLWLEGPAGEHRREREPRGALGSRTGGGG